jgi:hypothetical protein
VDERGKRVGANEVLFREVNERLREVGEGFSIVSEKAAFVCECGDGSCMERIEMSLADYELVRSHPTRFFVIKGHGRSDYEKIVEEKPDFYIVEKLPGGPAGIAIRDDPRS